MIVKRDYRKRVPTVTCEMSLQEFREWVEWAEYHSPDDGATKDMREWLNEVDPPQQEEEDAA